MPAQKASAKPTETKRCFVVSEFGKTPEAILERGQVLKHLIRKVLEPLGYQVKRADELDDPGQITHQIIERLIEDDLVVADLTNQNPNVYYELAVRHAVRKPVVTLLQSGESLPFDVKDVRTVFYDLHDPDKHEAAPQQLRQGVEAILKSSAPVKNPITAVRDTTLLQASEDPALRGEGDMLAAINEIRDDLRSLGRDSERSSRHRLRDKLKPSEMSRVIAAFVSGAAEDFTTEEIADRFDVPVAWAQRTLQELAGEEANGVYRVDGRWSSIPF